MNCTFCKDPPLETTDILASLESTDILAEIFLLRYQWKAEISMKLSMIFPARISMKKEKVTKGRQ